MIVETFVLTPFQQNTRIVACEETRTAICIDPGEASQELVTFLNSRSLTLQAITLTHGHLDHVGGTRDLLAAFPDAQVILHPDDELLYRALPSQPLFMGLQPHQLKELGMEYAEPPEVTRWWTNGEVYDVGSLQSSIRHCPGHTAGHVVLAELSHGCVFVGDCLFEGSVGRTDLPGGSHEQLMESIETQILSLDDDVVVYSGHGRPTTVGRERVSNPFLNGSYTAVRGRYI